MSSYRVPLRDFRFLLNDVFEATKRYEQWGFAHATPDLVDAILAEGAKLAEDVFAPLNQLGDTEGAKWWTDGKVTTPSGFKEAWDTFRDGGWGSISAPPDYGGQGLPESLELSFNEMVSAACQSFRLAGTLTLGAAHTINAHASADLKKQYLTKLISTEWAGTMCLTEPHAGSDLGIITTSATPADDGSYRISGTKIFITYGEHDLTENIVHLVLARLPDAPSGPKGISLFLVPKFVLEPDGTLGARNGVRCLSIEHKMGIHGSPTCVLSFEEASGYLVGAEHGGLAAMFTMMNYARIDVGQQGLGQGERALQGATAYARERLQMRAATGACAPDRIADPIIAHADVRRMLLTIKSLVEGSRALAIFSAIQLDRKHSPDASERRHGDELLAFLIPIVKGFLTEIGHEAAYWGVQCLGGHGYIRESGLEQYQRDARITSIYEGTNAIQANDLLRRKVIGSHGALLTTFLKEIDALVAELKGNEELHYQATSLATHRTEWDSIAIDIAKRSQENADEAAGAAFDFLMYSGYVTVAYFWSRMSQVALAKLREGAQDDLFYRAKLQTARFYFERILPRTRALAATMLTPSSTLMEMHADAFTM